MRGREFLMKDAYSFDTNKEKSLEAYQRMYDAYCRIFDRLGLQWRAVVADTGAIGGNYSHEFQVLADTGEDTLLFDPDSDYAVNIEKYDPATAPKPREQLVEKKGIEVGHCFHLGDLYSAKMNANVTLDDGKSVPVTMGCYGIGVSRLVAAAIEQCHDVGGIIWPEPMAPYKVAVINIRHADALCTDMATKLYLHLQSSGVEALYDDRDVSAGQKFAEADLIGLPWQAIIGPKNAADGKIEWKNRKTGDVQLLAADQLPW